jgi:hypothetical protein
MNSKDWTGNSKTTFTTLGASNHALEEREEHDFYATEPKAGELLLQIVSLNKNIWECACGTGQLSEVFKKAGHNVYSTDLIDRGYQDEIIDFLKTSKEFDGDIVTNPPYKYCNEFIEKALSLIPLGNKVVMFMGINFVEGKKRKEFLEKYPIKEVWVSSSRLNCAKNAEFLKYNFNSARCYAWYVWEKGYTGETILKWFN